MISHSLVMSGDLISSSIDTPEDMEDGACNAAYETIRSYLPNRYRNMTYDSFIAAPHLADLFRFENTQLHQSLLSKKLIKPPRQKFCAPPVTNDNQPGFFETLRRAFS